jgi:hypothetical protein
MKCVALSVFLVLIGMSLTLKADPDVAATTNTSTALTSGIAATIANNGLVNVNNISNTSTVINNPITIAANISGNKIKLPKFHKVHGPPEHSNASFLRDE